MEAFVCKEVEFVEAGTVVSCLSFHPKKAVVTVALSSPTMGSQFVDYDLVTGGAMGRVPTEETVTHLFHSLQAGRVYIVSAKKNGVIQLWNSEDYSIALTRVPSQKEEQKMKKEDWRPIGCMSLSAFQPLLFFNFQGTTTLLSLSLAPNISTAFKVDCGSKVKGFTNMATHPYKTLVGVSCADGSVRVFDTKTSLSALVVFDAEPARKHVPMTGVAFSHAHSHQDLVVGCSEAGFVFLWTLTGTQEGCKRQSHRPVVSITCHPYLNCFVGLSDDGTLRSWSAVELSRGKHVLDSSDLIASSNITKKEASYFAQTHAHLPACPPNLPSSLVFHRLLSFFAVVWDRRLLLQSSSPLAPAPRVPVISGRNSHLLLFSFKHVASPLLRFPLVCPMTLPPSFFISDDKFVYPFSYIIFVDGGDLKRYSIAGESASSICALPAPTGLPSGSSVRARRFVYSGIKKIVLVFLEATSSDGKEIENAANRYQFAVYMESENDKEVSKLRVGRDAAFLGTSHNRLAVLLPSPRISLYKISENRGRPALDTPLVQIDLPASMNISRVFPSCHSGVEAPPSADATQAETLYCYDERANALVACVDARGVDSNSAGTVASLTEGGPRFVFEVRDTLLQVVWGGDGSVGAIQTEQRLYLVGPSLAILASVDAVDVVSILWMGYSLLYTTDKHLMSLSINGTSQTVAALHRAGSVLCTALNDRVVCSYFEGGKVRFFSRPVGMFEVLAAGWLLSSYPLQQKHAALVRLLYGFDCSRVSDHLLSLIAGTAFPDLALKIAKSCGHFHADRLAQYAEQAKDFPAALKYLDKLVKTSDDDDALPPPPPPRHSFVLLGRACKHYGQFETARECFDKAGDHWELFHLFVAANSSTGLEALCQWERLATMEELDAFALLAACELRLGRPLSAVDWSDIVASNVDDNGKPRPVRLPAQTKLVNADLHSPRLPEWKLEFKPGAVKAFVKSEALPTMPTSEHVLQLLGVTLDDASDRELQSASTFETQSDATTAYTKSSYAMSATSTDSDSTKEEYGDTHSATSSVDSGHFGNYRAGRDTRPTFDQRPLGSVSENKSETMSNASNTTTEEQGPAWPSNPDAMSWPSASNDWQATTPGGASSVAPSSPAPTNNTNTEDDGFDEQPSLVPAPLKPDPDSDWDDSDDDTVPEVPKIVFKIKAKEEVTTVDADTLRRASVSLAMPSLSLGGNTRRRAISSVSGVNNIRNVPGRLPVVDDKAPTPTSPLPPVPSSASSETTFTADFGADFGSFGQ